MPNSADSSRYSTPANDGSLLAGGGDDTVVGVNNARVYDEDSSSTGNDFVQQQQQQTDNNNDDDGGEAQIRTPTRRFWSAAANANGNGGYGRLSECGSGGASSSRPDSPNYRRQMLLNHVLLLDAAHQEGHGEAYEELKRLIIFAGIFFLFMIIFVLLKFQVSLDDVFKWSPVVWLVGVIICGLLMNIFIQIKKFLKRRRAKRLREQQDLLYSLHLPTSFPCLAPPPHTEACCRCGGGLISPASGGAPRHLRHEDMFLVTGGEDDNGGASAAEPLAFRNLRIAAALPFRGYGGTSSGADVYDDALTQWSFFATSSPSSSAARGASLSPPILPSYEQVMRGAKTWLLSKAVCSAPPEERQNESLLPPTYSSLDVSTPDSPTTSIPPTSPLQINTNLTNEHLNHLLHSRSAAQRTENTRRQQAVAAGDIPPPAYDESVSAAAQPSTSASCAAVGRLPPPPPNSNIVVERRRPLIGAPPSMPRMTPMIVEMTHVLESTSRSSTTPSQIM